MHPSYPIFHPVVASKKRSLTKEAIAAEIKLSDRSNDDASNFVASHIANLSSELATQVEVPANGFGHIQPLEGPEDKNTSFKR